MKALRIPLWVKITLATFLVEGVMLAALLFSHVRHTEEVLTRQAHARLESLYPLLNAALLGPLVQRDLGSLREILDEVYLREEFTYLVLLDRDGRRIASVGLGPGQALPTPAADLEHLAESTVLDTHKPLIAGGGAIWRPALRLAHRLFPQRP